MVVRIAKKNVTLQRRRVRGNCEGIRQPAFYFVVRCLRTFFRRPCGGVYLFLEIRRLARPANFRNVYAPPCV